MIYFLLGTITALLLLIILRQGTIIHNQMYLKQMILGLEEK